MSNQKTTSVTIQGPAKQLAFYKGALLAKGERFFTRTIDPPKPGYTDWELEMPFDTYIRVFSPSITKQIGL